MLEIKPNQLFQDEISIAELRKVFELILSSINIQESTKLKIDHDYYWEIYPSEAFNVLNDKTPEIVVGQLTDDMSELKEILEKKRKPIGHDLEYLANIILYFSQKYFSSGA